MMVRQLKLETPRVRELWGSRDKPRTTGEPYIFRDNNPAMFWHSAVGTTRVGTAALSALLGCGTGPRRGRPGRVCHLLC